MVTFILVLLSIYVLLCGLMWNFQRSLLYVPDRAMAPPASYGLSGFSAIKVQTADHVRITLWHHAARNNQPTILYFTGNGGHLGYRAEMFSALARAGYGALAVSYRGYGDSEGTPTEQGIYADARAAVSYAQKELSLTPQQLVYFGESLGTGVAIQLATETPPMAVILQAPYTSILERAQELYPWLPVSLLATDRFESISKIKNIRVPLLIIHGERDNIVPVHHGRALLAAANEPKTGVFFPQFGHNDIDVGMESNEIDAFLKAQK